MPLLAAALIASVLMLSACATVDAQTTAYVGVEHPAPTLPSEVQVLRVEPARSNVQMGEILIENVYIQGSGNDARVVPQGC